MREEIDAKIREAAGLPPIRSSAEIEPTPITPFAKPPKSKK